MLVMVCAFFGGVEGLDRGIRRSRPNGYRCEAAGSTGGGGFLEIGGRAQLAPSREFFQPRQVGAFDRRHRVAAERQPEWRRVHRRHGKQHLRRARGIAGLSPVVRALPSTIRIIDGTG